MARDVDSSAHTRTRSRKRLRDGSSSEESDEEVICNAHAQDVRTALGVPPPCTHAAAAPPRTAASKATMPIQDHRHPGARLQRLNAQNPVWDEFFGPGGPAAAFRDEEAMRLAKEGWAPHLTRNPVQRRLPRERLLAPGPQATATDALVQEYEEKRMVEEIAPPSFVHHGMPVASLDHAMVRMQGMPFRVPRTVYPWVHDFFLTPKPHQPGKWRGITNAKLYNEFAFKRKFKLHGVQQLRSTLRPGDYMCGFDVQDFFPHIGLVDHFKDHFIFRHRRQGENFTRWYRFVSLMFGVHDAPRSSVRIMLPVLAFLRSLDV